VKIMAIFFLIFMVSMSFLYLLLQAEIIESGFILSIKKDRIENLIAEKDRIEVEMAQLSSMDRIKEIATTRLGMVLPEKTIYLAAMQRKVQLKGKETTVAENFSELELKR